MPSAAGLDIMTSRPSIRSSPGWRRTTGGSRALLMGDHRIVPVPETAHDLRRGRPRPSRDAPAAPEPAHEAEPSREMPPSISTPPGHEPPPVPPRAGGVPGPAGARVAALAGASGRRGAGHRALATTASGAPLRMAFVYFPNGAIQPCWWPHGRGQGFSSSQHHAAAGAAQGPGPGPRRARPHRRQRRPRRRRRPRRGPTARS